MGIPFEVLSTGSSGNGVVIDNMILVDCGVAFKLIKPHLRTLKLVLLTHIHSDHFRKSTIRELAAERPTLRFGCCRWLVRPLVDVGVKPANIDVYEFDNIYSYSIFDVTPVSLVHDVPNCGYKLHLHEKGKVLYATDTNNLNGISAPNYDLYLIEANYTDAEIQARINEKKANGEFVYERRVLRTHLSKAKCDDFIYKNIGPTGEYVYLHGHLDDEDEKK